MRRKFGIFRSKIVWERENYQFCDDQEASGVRAITVILFLDSVQ